MVECFLTRWGCGFWWSLNVTKMSTVKSGIFCHIWVVGLFKIKISLNKYGLNLKKKFFKESNVFKGQKHTDMGFRLNYLWMCEWSKVPNFYININYSHNGPSFQSFKAIYLLDRVNSDLFFLCSTRAGVYHFGVVTLASVGTNTKANMLLLLTVYHNSFSFHYHDLSLTYKCWATILVQLRRHRSGASQCLSGLNFTLSLTASDTSFIFFRLVRPVWFKSGIIDVSMDITIPVIPHSTGHCVIQYGFVMVQYRTTVLWCVYIIHWCT